MNSMMEALHHRGPDDSTCLIEKDIAIGFKRLSIIDLSHGKQPFYNEDGSVMVICNGEIYNYKEFQNEIKARGRKLRTNCDVEVIAHLYDFYGIQLLEKLNGQFAFALYDKRIQTLFIARDHFGVCPVFYSFVGGKFIFASEIKSLLKYPGIQKQIDLTAIDQLLTFPGIVSPTTFFKSIHSLKPGYYGKVVKGGEFTTHEYWDLDYPVEQHEDDGKSESYYAEKLNDLLTQSVRYRMNADVPVGFYLSGGLDSSLVGAMMKHINPRERYKSFSIGFPNHEDSIHDERKYQQLVARKVNSDHHEIPYDWSNVSTTLKKAVYFSEGALKETYNTCSLALSEAVNKNGIKVILSGEGSDEFFGGYVGYRFDVQRNGIKKENTLQNLLEDQLREKLWGDPNFFYEKNKYEFRETKQALFSERVNNVYDEFDCLKHLEINKKRLIGRSSFHRRSYLDLKLRLSDHLVSDHCDRVNYANSVEGRYPFLDIELINFVRSIPPRLKLNGLVEKYILKEVARKYLPEDIWTRQKFSFVAPGSLQLIQNKIEWVMDILSSDTIQRQGYFDPTTVERLKTIYGKPGFKLNMPFEDDLLIVVLTFNILLEVFDMPNF